VTRGIANVAVVIAAHGDRGGAEPNATLFGHRDAIACELPARLVAAGVLKGEPSIEAALADAKASGAGRVLVFPFFMADGYFVRAVLPARIAVAGAGALATILPPLGLEPRLAPLIHAGALSAARSAGFEAAASRLLLVGHGSELGPASADATRAMAARLGLLGGFAEIATAFIEEPPFLDDELAGARLPTVVAGFFSGDGLHAGEDVPQAIREAGARAVYAGPIGRHAGIPSIIVDAVRAALGG
jgi:sirohydrochlorin ferrochelatase